MRDNKNQRESDLILIMVSLLTIVTIGSIIQSKIILNNVQKQNQAYTNDVTLQIRQNIENQIKMHISDLNFIREKSLDKNFEVDYNLLKESLVQSSFREVLIIDKSGNVKDSNGMNVTIKGDFNFKNNTKESYNISYPVKISSYNEFNILYSIPILNNNKEMNGFICGIGNPELISEKLSSGVYSNKASTYIIKEDGEILFSNNKNGDNLIEYINESLLTDIKANLIKDEKGILYGDIISEENLYGLSQISNEKDWYILTTILMSNLLLDTDESMGNMSFILLATILLFIVIITYILNIQKKNKKRIDNLLYTDTLTGIRSYKKFTIDAQEFIDRRKKNDCIVIYFDIDKYKLINDIHGYMIGDKVLINIANNLNNCFKREAIYARMSGDLFALLIEAKDNKKIDEVIDIIKTKVGKIERTNVYNLDIDIELCIGVYRIEEDENDIKRILDNADMARLKLKESRYQNYVVFDENMSKEKKKILQLEKDLFSAIKNNEFIIYYQPKFNIKTGKIVGSEALLRWKHPVMGMVSPMLFIPIAEKTRFINNIGRWVFEEVCLKLRQLMDEGIEVVPVAINLSRIELYQQDLTSILSNGLEKYNIDPKLIEIEITESTALNDIDFINEKLSEIRRLGMNVAMDDFGTGNSNLSNLKDIKIDVLKLDRSLLLDIENNEKTEVMVKSIVALSKNLSLKTICEGVENMTQVEILKGTDCEIVQGYVFSKPVDMKTYKELLNKNNGYEVTN